MKPCCACCMASLKGFAPTPNPGVQLVNSWCNSLCYYYYHLCWFLMLVGLHLMPNVLQGAWWSHSWHHVVAFSKNSWTRSFALGYWLFYFSSVLFWLWWGKKTFTGKRLSQVCMYVALFTLALIGDSHFLWQLVVVLCRANLLLDQSWWGTWN